MGTGEGGHTSQATRLAQTSMPSYVSCDVMPPATITTSSSPSPSPHAASSSCFASARCAGEPHSPCISSTTWTFVPIPAVWRERTGIKRSRLISRGHCPSPPTVIAAAAYYRHLPCIHLRLRIEIYSCAVYPFHACPENISGPASKPFNLPSRHQPYAYAWLSSLAAFFFFLGARRGCAMRFLSSSSCNDFEDATLSLQYRK